MNAPGPYDDDPGEALSDINTTPLIDVMLVLLIMLIVTVPAISDAIHLGLAPVDEVARTPPLRVVVRIDSSDRITWNGEPVVGRLALEERLRRLAAFPDATISLRPAADAPYRALALVMAAIERTAPTLGVDLDDPASPGDG